MSTGSGARSFPGRVLLQSVLIAWLLSGTTLAQQGSATALKLADQILNELSHLRGLEIKTPVIKGVKNRQEIRSALEEKIRREYSPEQIELEEEVLKKLGLLPPDYDYFEGLLALLTEQLAGYYDPELKTLYIADWIPVQLQQTALAHELAHALQDQHFDLNRILKESRGNDDRMLARQAIVEGEAVALMFDHSLRQVKRTFLNMPDLSQYYQTLVDQADSGQKALKSAPEFLRELLLFPYAYGARFLQIYRRWHSWADLEKVYAVLPSSTEQIMHPEKYTGRKDEPTAVEPNLPAGMSESGWESVYQNVLGEFVTYHLLKRYIKEPTARMASRGWDGDSIQLLKHPDGRTGLSLCLVWDSEDDAAQFFKAYADLVSIKHPSIHLLDLPRQGPPVLEWGGETFSVLLELEGNEVRVIEKDLGTVPGLTNP